MSPTSGRARPRFGDPWPTTRRQPLASSRPSAVATPGRHPRRRCQLRPRASVQEPKVEAPAIVESPTRNRDTATSASRVLLNWARATDQHCSGPLRRAGRHTSDLQWPHNRSGLSCTTPSEECVRRGCDNPLCTARTCVRRTSIVNEVCTTYCLFLFLFASEHVAPPRHGRDTTVPRKHAVHRAPTRPASAYSAGHQPQRPPPPPPSLPNPAQSTRPGVGTRPTSPPPAAPHSSSRRRRAATAAAGGPSASSRRMSAAATP